MSSAPIRVRNHDSRDQEYVTNHRCNPRTWPDVLLPDGSPDPAQLAVVKDEDKLHFPVGIYGVGYPQGVSFQAMTLCLGCEQWVSRWFEWYGPVVYLPSY